MKILLMITCLGDVMRPGAGIATVKLLRRLGHEVEFRSAQTCCGQPMYNSGYADLARAGEAHDWRVRRRRSGRSAFGQLCGDGQGRVSASARTRRDRPCSGAATFGAPSN